jgi:carnitine O-acetyltransferase
MGAIYESGSIRWFKYGRTDTIRSCTNASHAFAVAMQNTKKSAAEKCDALVESIKAHKDYSVMAMSGKGIDRHLLGLKILSNDMGIDTPDIFKDLAYERSTHFVLSTSQVPVQDHDIFLCFGAVVPDGYGICYNPQENRFIISISSFHECSETDSMLFAKKLRESLMEMKEVLLMGNMPKNKL